MAAQPLVQLANAATDQTISAMTDGMTIDTGVVGTALSITAQPAGKAGSVVFKLDGKTVSTETYAPYSIAGDANGNLNAWTPTTGKHTLQVQQFAAANGKGTLQGQRTVAFTVVSSQGSGIPSSGSGGNIKLDLINARTDKAVFELTGSTTIDIAKVGNQLSVEAIPPAGSQSVVFKLDGKTLRTESAAPFAIGGDNGRRDFYSWTPSGGQHTLEAIAYGKINAQGVIVGRKSVTVNVVNGGVTSPPASPPPPITGNEDDNTPSPGGPLNGNSPQAVLKLVGGASGVAGMPVVVNAVDSIVPNSPLFAKYQWDFGDPTGGYNRLPGWTAGHIYDNPGTYTVRLTVTDANGKSSTATQSINVAADTRRTVYVDAASGSDNNPGTITAPIRSFDRASDFATNNVKILFKRGQSWNTNYWMSITGDNVYVGAYGSGANPVLNVVSNKTAIQTFGGSDRTVIENLTFDSPYKAGNLANKVGVNGIFAGGTNLAIRGCTFLNVDDGVNANQQPRGFIFQDNDAPLLTGVRGYMLWAEGQDIVILGNSAANSTREHNLRIKDGDRLLVAYNSFTNISRESIDKQDIRKGTIQMQRGSWAYIYGNSVKDGPMRIGPRGEATEPASTRTSWVVVDNNKISNYQLDLYPGATNVMIRNNVFNNSAQAAIGVNPSDPQGRPLSNIHILNNTGYNYATTGRFLRVEGGLQPDSITLGENTYIAPNLHVGSDNTAGVSIAANNLSGFKAIFNNVWPIAADTIKYAEGGIMWVSPGYTGQSGYKDAREWLAYPEVTGDVFRN
ncbi:PKD domain-containing protein [Humisphaera borealis]|uniref:PKD domain-containing protein n=1 Tax=Humisphaera borealis TaxID=2807512 RepID=A0A7M2WR20_9BACT|nr:PKD domain-containing protein [Humisphaera borealis]QOV88005.1 PKD domain-containing protein [Humisphaera borealis]